MKELRQFAPSRICTVRGFESWTRDIRIIKTVSKMASPLLMIMVETMGGPDDNGNDDNDNDNDDDDDDNDDNED